MRPTLFATALVVVLLATYAVGVVRHRQWPWWRTVVYVASVLVFWWCLDGTPALLRSQEPLWGVAGIATANAVVGFGVVLGAPLRLLERVLGRPVRWLHSVVVQGLTYPVVVAVLNAFALIGIFDGGWFAGARADDASWFGLILVCAALGFLNGLQLLTLDFAPPGRSPTGWMVVAMVSALINQAPGVVVAAFVNTAWGGLLWAMMQPVVITTLTISFLDWFRRERLHTARVDAALDALEAEGIDPTQPWWERPDQKPPA